MSDMNELDSAIEAAFPPETDTSQAEGGENEGQPGDGEEEQEATEGQEGEKGGETDPEGVTGDEKEGQNKPDEPAKPKKKDRYQERIDHKTRENYELKARIAQLEEERDAKPPELPPQPDPANYRYRNEEERIQAQRQFDYDMGKWQSEVERINTEHANRGQVKIQNEQRQYFTKMSGEKSIYGEYDTALRNLSNYKMTPELHNALLHDSNNTDLFCFLGNNPKLADEVFKLRGYQQSYRLAEISYKLQAAKVRSKAKPSSAPAPTGKPKGGSGGKGGKSLADMSDTEYRNAMKKAKAKLSKF